METELYINNQKADLSENVGFPLTFQLSDIRDPETRNASYSKTIVIPGTKRNNILFQHIFEINVDNNFNPNLKSDASVLGNGIETFAGYLQLIQINKISYDLIEYECLLIGNLKNLFADIGDKYVQGNSDVNDDIDFADLNHQLTITNIDASFTAPIGEGYIYTTVDYGLSDSLKEAVGPQAFVTDLFPGIYVKEYIDRIFEKHGYTYQSDFFNTDTFKRLVIPYSSGKRPQITDIFRDFQTTRASLSTTQVISGPIIGNRLENLHFNDVTTPPNSDPGANLNTSTYLWTPPNYKSFRMQCGIDFLVTSSTSGSGTMAITLELLDDTGVSTIGSLPLTATFNPTNNRGGGVWATDTISGFVSFSGNVLTTNEYRFRLKIVQGSLTNFQTIEVNSTTYMKMEPTNMDMYAYDIMPLNGCVPKKFRQMDILMGIIKMFNLYLDVDKDNPNIYLIEPRNDYYDSGSIVDWSSKHDNSQQVEVLPMSELDWKQLKFTYAEDSDYLNKQYKDLQNRIYGEQDVIVNNDFMTDKKTIALPFAPTPIFNETDTTTTPARIGAIIPGIFTVNSDSTRSMYEGKPRILYFGGLQTRVFTLQQIGTGSVNVGHFPIFSNMDDPVNSTIDILFNTPATIFYSYSEPIALTDNNLYNKYYSRMIEEVVNINAKMVRAYFKLTSADIQNFRFKDKIFWRDAYYYVNKIIDYDPVIGGSTQVELLYINSEPPTFSPTQTTQYGQVDTDIQ